MALLVAMTVAMTSSLVIPAEAVAAPRTPAKVATVKVQSHNYNSVKISWSKAKNTKKYRVYQGTSKSGKYKSIGTTSKRTFVKKGLVTGKTYYYKVRGINGSKLGKVSKAKSVKPKLKTVTSLKGKGASSNSISLSWKKVSGAKGYQVYRATSAKGKYKKIKTTTKTSYKNSGLSKNKSYYYKVRAYRKVGKKYVYSSFTKPVGKKLVVSSNTSLNSIRADMLKRVNAERKKAGVPPLKGFKIIDGTAQEKAVDMHKYKYFDHYSPRLKWVFNQYEKVGLLPYGGENIASGQRTTAQVMSDWMKSPGHRANILFSDFTYLGVGYYKGYWVQQFY